MAEPSIKAELKMGPLEWVLCVLLVGIVSVTFWQVISRYVLGTSLAWSEELARYLFQWLAALGAAYGFKTKSHFALRFAVDRLNRGMQKVAATLIVALMAIFLVIFIWYAYQYTQLVSGQIGPGTELSKAWPASSAFVGGVLSLYYLLRNWFNELRSGRLGEPVDGEGA